MHSCHSDRSGGIYLNSHRRRRFHILVFLCSCIPAFFIKSLRVRHVLHGKFFCAFLDSFLHKLNVTPTPLNTQNKPIFSNLRIAVSLCGKRTQASSLKPRASENKPIQTHFLSNRQFTIYNFNFSAIISPVSKPQLTIIMNQYSMNRCIVSESITGLLKRINKHQFAVRCAQQSYRPGRVEIMVAGKLSRKLPLAEGARVTGQVERTGGKPTLVSIDTIGGLAPEEFAKRKSFQELIAVDPHQRFDLGSCDEGSMRMIDLIAPIGKGTRQLIVSPPKAGKTVLLEQIVAAIEHCDPQTRTIVLLIDERPEEVTQFRRAVGAAEVVASTIDHKTAEHVELAKLMLAHVQTELECGKDVVLVIDSLTRLARAFNSQGRGGRNRQRGHTMSGGLEAGVLEIPRRLFGLARNIENGGSLTIIATCLVDTGSRMDQLIFEEFKGTGNSEVVLDRSLAEARIFPAIDIPASGTRKEAKLYTDEQTKGLATLRKVLSSYRTREATEAMGKLLQRFPDNDQFLKSMAKQ